MSLGLTTSLMQMPTVRQLLDLMLLDLRGGRSVLGLIPEGVDSSLLRSALWDGLEHFMHIQEVPILGCSLRLSQPHRTEAHEFE